MIGDLFTTAFLISGLRAASPIVLAAMGNAITERAGIINIGVEGMMLGGSFAAIATTIETGSAWAGLAAGAVTGVLLALAMAVAVVDLDADPIVAGFAVNLFAAGFTVLLLSEMYGSKGSIVRPEMATLPTVRLPLAGVPVLGAFAAQNLMVWVAFLSVGVTFVFLFRTPVGLRLRAAGENAGATLAAGVQVRRIRYGALCLSGLAAGLAGANLTIGYLGSFTRDMTAGRGFIALAAALFARGHPIGTAAAALLFGLADAVGNRLQGRGIASQFVLMVPYIVTAATLTIVSIQRTRRRRRALVTVWSQ